MKSLTVFIDQMAAEYKQKLSTAERLEKEGKVSVCSKYKERELYYLELPLPIL